MSIETTAYPDGITEEHVSPVLSWRHHASPVSLVIFGLVVFAALSGVLGRERTWVAEAGGAELEVHAPEIIRNGEFFEMRVRLQAAEPIAELAIGIEESLWEDMTVNTMIPGAAEEASADGEARFTFAELPAGTSFLFKIDLQVNPDILGGNAGTITLYDGETELVATDLSITVLP